jgi:hypothetical protein
MVMPSCSVRWALSSSGSVFTRFQNCGSEAVCGLVSMVYMGALGRWRDRPLVLEHLSIALADCAAPVGYL